MANLMNTLKKKTRHKQNREIWTKGVQKHPLVLVGMAEIAVLYRTLTNTVN